MICVASSVTLKRSLSKLHDCLRPGWRASTLEDQGPRPLLATLRDGRLIVGT